MLIYYCIIIIIAVLYFFLTKCKVRDSKDLFLLISFLLLIGISAVRAESVGGDLGHYIPHYKIFGNMAWSDLLANRTKYGYIFAVLCKLAYMISPSGQSFLVVTSIFCLLPIYFFVKKYSIDPFMSIFIYITFGFYTNTFNSVRSSLALGVGVLLFDFVIKRQLWKFLLFFLIAVEIHQTFLLFGILYPLYAKKITKKYMVASLTTCFLLSQTFSALTYLYAFAMKYDEGAYRNLTQTSGGYTLLLLMIAITVFFYAVNKDRMDGNTLLWMHCLIIACCTLCFATALTLLTRVAMFFYITLIVSFPEMVKRLKKPYLFFIGKCAVYMMFFIYFSFFVMKTQKEYDGSNSQRTIPYEFFWDKYDV